MEQMNCSCTEKGKLVERVGIQLRGVKPFGFYEYLVVGLICKANDLVFGTQAISWTDAFDVATVHMPLFQILSNDLVVLAHCVGDMASTCLGWSSRRLN